MREMHLLFCGLPGSGKSSWARSTQNHFRFSHVIISTDAIREKLYGSEETQGSWAEISQEITRQFEEAVADGDYVIYDATNLSREHRAWPLEWLRSADPRFNKWEAVVVDLPVKNCWENNQKRDRKVPLDVFLEMVDAFEMPQLNEGFERITIIR